MPVLNLKPISNKCWDNLLSWCRERDVEAGETPEYMYSVRTKTRVLTIWTQQGWRDGWYVARVVPAVRGTRVKLSHEDGTAPAARAWSKDALEQHLRELISRIAPEERP